MGDKGSEKPLQVFFFCSVCGLHKKKISKFLSLFLLCAFCTFPSRHNKSIKKFCLAGCPQAMDEIVKYCDDFPPASRWTTADDAASIGLDNCLDDEGEAHISTQSLVFTLIRGFVCGCCCFWVEKIEFANCERNHTKTKT